MGGPYGAEPDRAEPDRAAPGGSGAGGFEAGGSGAGGFEAGALARQQRERAPHWSELAEEEDGQDEAGIMVRPYTITRGRTAPDRDDLTLITVLTTDEPAADAALARAGRSGTRALQHEHRLILERCRRPAAVAEVAAGLDLPVSVTKILLGDLIAQGLLKARAPISVAPAAGMDTGLLSAVRDGLRRL
ncbi:DUF742 domain-containing protein [Kitasatospora sp. NPDC051170]|uniref:DUF742 domain-containing protein n=1 Tax=Kitasatospora sp. NPDC051170 TaxID=3364056 RepID=UPI0037A06C74